VCRPHKGGGSRRVMK